MFEPRTRRERIAHRMAEILAEKLTRIHPEMSVNLFLTIAEMQADEETPLTPQTGRVSVEFRLKEKV